MEKKRRWSQRTKSSPQPALLSHSELNPSLEIEIGETSVSRKWDESALSGPHLRENSRICRWPLSHLP